jgi:hypothetical protein
MEDRMRTKIVVGLGVVALALSGCSVLDKLKGGGKEGATAGSGSVPSAAPTTGGAAGLLDKALSFATSPFSGEMQMEVRNGPPGSPTTASTFKVKGTKMRIETAAAGAGGPPGAVIVEPVEKKMTMLDDKTKTAMVMHIPDSATGSGSGSAGGPGAGAGKKTEFKKTGKSDVVAGYSCDIYSFDGDEPGEKGEACIASGLSFLGMGGKMAGGWASSISSVGGFPLRVVVSQAGTEKSRWEVKSVARKDVPESDFQVPPGYKVMDMDELMKNLGGGHVPPGLAKGRGAHP